MSTLVELKPCPFCGHKPETYSWQSPDEKGTNISCTNDTCGLAMSNADEETAVARWNTRAFAAELDSEEMVEKVCKEIADHLAWFPEDFNGAAKAALAVVKERVG